MNSVGWPLNPGLLGLVFLLSSILPSPFPSAHSAPSTRLTFYGGRNSLFKSGICLVLPIFGNIFGTYIPEMLSSSCFFFAETMVVVHKFFPFIWNFRDL